MTIKEGDTLPEVTLHHMTEKGPTPITSSELFGGKKLFFLQFLEHLHQVVQCNICLGLSLIHKKF